MQPATLMRGKALRVLEESAYDLEIAVVERAFATSHLRARRGALGLLPCSFAILVSSLPSRSSWLIGLGVVFVIGAFAFILYHRSESKSLARYLFSLRRQKAVREVLRG